MSEEAGEKSQAPTAKRRGDAVKRGDVLRSRELATAAAFGSGTVCFLALGPWLVTGMEAGLADAFTFEAADLRSFSPQRAMLGWLVALLPPLLILGGVIAVATLLAQLVAGEGRFLLGNLTPKFSRIDPAAGLKRMLGAHSLVELGKSMAKLLLIGMVAWWWSLAHLPDLWHLGRAPLERQIAGAWEAVSVLLLALAVGLAVIAALDWPIEWLRRTNRLRMTQQETRDEHKETEGSPEGKAALRQRQRAVARGGAARAVKEADFLLVNPAHFAVALAYDPARASAPVLLGKGRDEKALAMRELAAEAGKPVLHYPALARSVYFTTAENQVVREELYAAVATVLAFVLALKRGEKREPPTVSVPQALRYNAAGELGEA